MSKCSISNPKVGEAVQFLHSLGWLHASLSSHAIQLVSLVII